MDSADDIGTRSRSFAQRFLQTAVVVDNEAFIRLEGSDGPQAEVVVPSRRSRASSQDDEGPVDRSSIHTLNAGSVMDAFSALGVICGVVSPTDSATETMRQADIVVLDWLLRNGEPEYALTLLRDLVAGEVDRNSLRLVAVYTGEARLEEICSAVVGELENAGLDAAANETNTEISYRHGRVVLYAKPAVNLPEALRERCVSEESLPERLVRDFALMTEGLLPGIALVSLTAVREGEHMVLDRFSADLDPAFLSHKACLSNPDDAERQIVNHVAEELRGLMDNAVAGESPAGDDAVENWIRHNGDESAGFTFGERNLDLEQTIVLANKGLSKSVLKDKAFEGLCAGFSGSEVAELNERLAWIMSFRTVYNAPPPLLWLGSVVTELTDGNERHLICMRPRCDCVRLKEETSFFFLPLVEPKGVTGQIVVRLNGTYKRLGIQTDSDGWVRRQFKPSTENGAVTATIPESDRSFEFTDTSGTRYKWCGELRAEFAQRIAHTFATTLSRVAVAESEWLRRIAKK